MARFKEDNSDSLMWYTCLQGRAALRPCFAALLLLLLVGCAPKMYSVNMQYVPTGSIIPLEKPAQPIAVTVAAFEDLRKIDDTVKIGRVVKSRRTVIDVFPKFVMPADAVTSALKGLFRQAGYSVSSVSPPWDLQEANIKKEWNAILIGGSIDELEVICVESLTKKDYTAKVKLTVLFADTRAGKIFYTVTTDSGASLEHVLFSEEKLEQQINIALSEAVEKIFADKKIANMIREAAGQ